MALTNSSMAGAAILNDELINIPDCYQDERFNPSIDKKTGLKTIQMLCVPIKDTSGQAICHLTPARTMPTPNPSYSC